MIRTLTVVASLLAFAAVLALDSPVQGGEPSVSATFASEPGTMTSVCPGPQTIPVGDMRSGDADLDSGSTDVRFDVLPEGGVMLDEGTAFDPVGGSVERIGTGDIAGLAGLTCAAPAREQWLVGGSTTLGSSARLVLSNPADTPVSANVVLHTAVGQAEGEASVVLGPRAQQVVLLEAVEPEIPGLAVHISASGAGVSAALQDSRLDGFLPAGSDWVTASTLGTTLAIPVPSPTDGETLGRIAMVAPDGADVTLSMVSAAGEVAWLGEQNYTLEAGVLTELPVPAADTGMVLVQASAPVTAASVVRVAREAATRDGAQAFDLAWTGGQDVHDTRMRASVVPSRGDVALLAYAQEPGTYVFDAQGDQVEVSIPAGVSVLTPLDIEPGTVLVSDEPVVWALVLTDEPGFITTLEPVSVDPVSIDTEVAVGGYLPRD